MAVGRVNDRGVSIRVKTFRSNKEKTRQPRECAASGPYPEVKVEGPNLHYASLLLDNYAGINSELTAINQYLYHQLRLEVEYPVIAQLLECLALVEMEHLQMLGKAICLLGGEPRMVGCPAPNAAPWWSAKNVYYGRHLCDMLSADIHGEKVSIEKYQGHIRKIEDRHLRALLTRIAEDEMEHLRYLQGIYQEHCTGK